MKVETSGIIIAKGLDSVRPFLMFDRKKVEATLPALYFHSALVYALESSFRTCAAGPR